MATDDPTVFIMASKCTRQCNNGRPNFILQRVLQCDTCMTSLNTSLQESHHQSCQSVPILHSIIPGTSGNTVLNEVIGTDNTRELLYPAAEHQLCGRCKQLFPRFEIGQHIFFCGAEQERDPFRRDNHNEKLVRLLAPHSIHSLLKTYHLYAQFDPFIFTITAFVN